MATRETEVAAMGENGLGADIPYDLLVNIGMMTVVWAQSELTLDALVGVIFHYCGGKEIEQRLPMALKSKLSFVKRAHARLSVLAPYRDRASHLVGEMVELKERRHDILHGAAMRKFEDGSFLFFRTQANGELHGSTVKKLKPEEIQAVTMRMALMGRDLAFFAKEVAGKFAPADAPTIGGTITRHLNRKKVLAERNKS